MILVSNIMIALHYCDSTMPLSTSSQEVSKLPSARLPFVIYTLLIVPATSINFILLLLLFNLQENLQIFVFFDASPLVQAKCCIAFSAISVIFFISYALSSI